jgi:hypothetical protein
MVEPIRIETRDGGFDYIVIEMSQYFFTSTVQIELGTSDLTVDVEMRLAFNNAYGDPISYTVTDGSGNDSTVELIDEFVLSITGVEEDTGCEDVKAVIFEQARSDFKLSFMPENDGDIAYSEHWIDQTLVTHLDDPTKDCAIKYKLFA